jgi:hypothetical protein
MLTAVATLAAVLIVWVVGIVALGQYSEDLCNRPNLPPEVSGWQLEATKIPPNISCVYRVSDGEALVVTHRILAWVSAVWLVVLPVGGLGLAVGVGRERASSSRPTSRQDSGRSLGG